MFLHAVEQTMHFPFPPIDSSRKLHGDDMPPRGVNETAVTAQTNRVGQRAVGSAVVKVHLFRAVRIAEAQMRVLSDGCVLPEQTLGTPIPLRRYIKAGRENSTQDRSRDLGVFYRKHRLPFPFVAIFNTAKRTRETPLRSHFEMNRELQEIRGDPEQSPE